MLMLINIAVKLKKGGTRLKLFLAIELKVIT
jgi:hypothetical protein